MVKLQCSRFDAAGVPVLSDAEIDRFAHEILADYKPALLRKPGKIDYAHFIERYLGANLEYQDIYNEDPEKPIFGMAIYDAGNVRVFDRDALTVEDKWMEGRTVILDNFIMQEGKEGLALFTALHEGGHVCIHFNAYSDMDDCDFDVPIPAVYCRKDNIENFIAPKGHRSPKEWMEHQASFFAACIAMPNKTFTPFVREILHDHDYRKPHIVTGINEDNDYIAEELLPEIISETYGVSKKAAFIKLIKCGFVIEQKRRVYEFST